MHLLKLILILKAIVLSNSFHVDYRKQFLERKARNRINKNRVILLDKNDSANEEYIDGVAHHKISNDGYHTKWKLVRDFDKDFRRLLAMEGVTYNYKRDVTWRTWRSVMYPNKTEQIICYKCNGGNNYRSCNGGFWTIEEKPPPCPYEFYSLINDDMLCGAYYTQYKNTKSACPSKIKFSDLTSTCDNPIETSWRFTRVFNYTKQYKNVICGGRDYCEIFTTYTISPEHVIFRIINSSNDIIYSRVMKTGNNNYLCVEDCGIYNPTTKVVNTNEKPYKMDLLPKSNKKKREYNINAIDIIPETIKNSSYMSKKGGKAQVNRLHTLHNKSRPHIENFVDFLLQERVKSTTISHCKDMANLMKEEDAEHEETEENYY